MTAVRRFRGPAADQIFLLSAGRQAESVYEGLRDALTAEGTGPQNVFTETLFLRHVRDDVAATRAARSRVLGDAGMRPATTIIGQAPLDPEGEIALAAVAVVPRSRSEERRVGKECRL